MDFRPPLVLTLAKIVFGVLLLEFWGHNNCAGQVSDDSQTITINGTVSSKNGPVPYASVYLANTTFGTVSNESGDFLLKFPSTYLINNGYVVVSSIGYESVRIRADSLQKMSAVYLQESITRLQEVIVNSAKIDSADIFLNRAIASIKTNFPRKRHLAEGFYRELSINDTIYTRLIEAAIVVDEPGYKGNSVDSDLEVEGNKVKIIEMRRSDDNRSYDALGWTYKKVFGEKNDIYEVLNDNYVRFIGKKNNHFLSKDFLQEYDMTTDSQTSFDGESVIILKLTAKNKDIFFTRHVEIAINKRDYGILRIDHNLIVNQSREELKKYAIDGKYFYRSTVLYRKFGETYVPYYIYTKKYASNTNPLKNDKVQYSSLEFLLTNLFYQDYERVKKKQALEKDVDINTLPNAYNERFWRDYQTVLINPLGDPVKRDLEKTSTLESQFQKN